MWGYLQTFGELKSPCLDPFSGPPPKIEQEYFNRFQHGRVGGLTVTSQVPVQYWQTGYQMKAETMYETSSMLD